MKSMRMAQMSQLHSDSALHDIVVLAHTRYFHCVANGRNNKKRIHTLVQDEGTIEGLDNLKNYITNYYKDLFGAPEEGNFFMDESQIDDIPQVSVEENNFLMAEYSEEEVRNAIF
jgi:hypothetical protein